MSPDLTAQNAMMFKALIILSALLVLQLGAITGLVRTCPAALQAQCRRTGFTLRGSATHVPRAHLPRPSLQVFTVVKAMQQTTVSASSPVMTVKGTDTPVQVANSEFYVDPATGQIRTRTPSDAASGSGARHLLQDSDSSVRVASADFKLHASGLMLSSSAFSQPSLLASLNSVDSLLGVGVNGSSSGGGRRLLQSSSEVSKAAPATVLPPVCEWASEDLFDIATCYYRKQTGPVSVSDKTEATVPWYAKCSSMTGACQSFEYASKISLPVWNEGYGTMNVDMVGRMCATLCVLTRFCCRALTLRFTGRR